MSSPSKTSQFQPFWGIYRCPVKYRSSAPARPAAVRAAPTIIAVVKENPVIGERAFLQNSGNLLSSGRAKSDNPLCMDFHNYVRIQSHSLKPTIEQAQVAQQLRQLRDVCRDASRLILRQQLGR